MFPSGFHCYDFHTKNPQPRKRRIEEIEICGIERNPDMKDLPHDIIVDILSRLPVKSLVRFRCVSKLWNSAISDPQFVKLHLNRAFKSDDIYTQRQRLIFSCHNLYSLEYEAIGSDIDDVDVLELEYPLKDKPNEWAELLGHAKDGLLYCRTPAAAASDDDDDNDFPVIVKLDIESSLNSRNWVEILGSCNGLVCIVPYEDTLFLFNPSTRGSKRIPDPPVEIFPVEWNPNCVNVYGFGYDDLNDDYKVVRLASGVFVSVYSLRTNCWRRVESPPFNTAYETGRQLNGAIHWVVSREEDMHSKCMVASFDLGQEFFWDMPAPDVLDSSSDFAVGVLNECLCLLHNYGQMHNDFWVMKEYGVSESWTKVEISISYICMKPLCITKNDEALLEIDGKLVTYNFEDDSSRDLVVRSIPVGVGFEADTYLESLVSPNAYGGSGSLQC